MAQFTGELPSRRGNELDFATYNKAQEAGSGAYRLIFYAAQKRYEELGQLVQDSEFKRLNIATIHDNDIWRITFQKMKELGIFEAALAEGLIEAEGGSTAVAVSGLSGVAPMFADNREPFAEINTTEALILGLVGAAAGYGVRYLQTSKGGK